MDATDGDGQRAQSEVMDAWQWGQWIYTVWAPNKANNMHVLADMMALTGSLAGLGIF